MTNLKMSVANLRTLASALPVEKVRAVSESDFEFKFTGNENLLKKIQKLKGLLAHKRPNISMAELIDTLCDLGLEKWDKTREKTVAKGSGGLESKIGAAIARNHNQTFAAPRKANRIEISNRQEEIPSPMNTSQAEIKRQVWRRANGKCENCHSSYAVEIDHRLPRAVGGDNTLSNMRLLCRACNQRAAIEFYGLTKMTPFFEKQDNRQFRPT